MIQRRISVRITSRLRNPVRRWMLRALSAERVKGRDIGEPQWGNLEILENGKWKEYIPD